MSKRYGSLEQRFWNEVYPEPNSGCWIWGGPVDENGYGRFRDGSRKTRTHRLSMELHCGKIPESQYVLHSCDSPFCVNPDHLRFGTNHENILDKVQRNRDARCEASPFAKLTQAQVDLILLDRRTQRVIAAEYGVTHGVIGRIKRGEKWKRPLQRAC